MRQSAASRSRGKRPVVKCGGLAFGVVATFVLSAAVRGTEKPVAPSAGDAVRRGRDWLLKNQNADGSWGSHNNPLLGGFDEFFVNPETHRSWTVATTSLGCMAMFEAPHGDESVRAFERGISYILANALVKRPSEWDTDNVWAYVYSLPALARAYKHPTPGLAAERERIAEVTAGVLEKMRSSQTPHGGWGYYDFEVYQPVE
jgi:hypothetical protein